MSPSEPGKRRELVLRVASAAVLAPVALAAIWFGMPWFAIFVTAALIVAGSEWRHICGLEGRGLGTLLLTAPLFIALGMVFFGPFTALVILAVAVAITAVGFGSSGRERVWACGGVVLIGAATISAIDLRAVPGAGLLLVLALFVTVWLSDIGGYVFGRLIGGPKLAPRISPNKTWAGAFGAVALSAAGAGIATVTVDGVLPGAILFATLLSVFAQGGDLFESWVKRRHGVKDSGTIIPGHGGVLDRIDSLLFAAPAMAILVRLGGTVHGS